MNTERGVSSGCQSAQLVWGSIHAQGLVLPGYLLLSLQTTLMVALEGIHIHTNRVS